MRFSVVINTYNRGKSLRDTLRSLRYQTYPDFEVVTVNGPSTDDSEAILDEFGDTIRRYRCPAAHLSKSRNIGIAAAAGDVVAFIDDDGIPEPRWLEELAAAYDAPDVGGAGGIVYDHTGYALQFARSVCDRRGTSVFDVPIPHASYQVRGADPFVHLIGTNSSFRRAVLVEIGGFDEEFEYYLDETEVCMRVNDFGYRVRLLDGAAVHHKFRASHLRSDQKALKKPYPVVKNKFYFALRNARDSADLLAVVAECERFAEKMIADGRYHLDGGRLTPVEFDAYCRDVQAGVRDGLERGMTGRRKSAAIPPADPASFRPYPILTPAGKRLTVCFVSQEYPPGVVGGIGRFTHELARGMAALGHEIHVVTRTTHHPTVDLEEGVWVRRIPPRTDGPWNSPDMQPLVRKNLGWAAAAHAEVKRVAADRTIDLVSAPVWDSEGLFCHLDDDLKTVLSLHTTIKTTADLNASWQIDPGVLDTIDIERLVVRSNLHLTAPSHDILRKVKKDYGAPAPPAAGRVIYHGIPDRSAEYAGRKPDGRVRVLTVGRLEKRKGTDLFLEAAAILCQEFPKAEFVLVGDDTIPMDGRPQTYREHFEQRFGHEPWAARVVFRGKVSEEQLYAEYAGCDVFCLPARYESFGLVLIEAMVFGKPVVAAAAGGMPEIVEDGVTGHLVYPDNVASLVEHLRPLLASRELREKFGAAARARYEQAFRLDAMVRNTVRAYTEMAESFAA